MKDISTASKSAIKKEKEEDKDQKEKEMEIKKEKEEPKEPNEKKEQESPKESLKEKNVKNKETKKKEMKTMSQNIPDKKQLDLKESQPHQKGRKLRSNSLKAVPRTSKDKQDDSEEETAAPSPIFCRVMSILPGTDKVLTYNSNKNTNTMRNVVFPSILGIKHFLKDCSWY